MRKFLKRLGSLALAILMVASLLPVQAFAAEEATEPAIDWTEVATFEQLQTAIAAGGYIKLTESFAAKAAIEISAAEVTIDFNGKVITLCDNVGYPFMVKKKTTLMDSSGNDAGGMTLTAAYTGGETQMLRDAGSQLIIESGSYVFDASATGQLGKLIHTWGKTTINGGVFSATKKNNAGVLYGIYRDSAGSAHLTVNGGSITVTANTAGNAYGIYATAGNNYTGQTKSYLTVTDGDIDVNVSDSATTRSAYGVYAPRGTTVISGGTVSVTGSGKGVTCYGLSYTNNAKVTVKKYNVNVDSTSTTSGAGYAYGIANWGSSSELYLTAEDDNVNITVNSAGGANAYGLLLDGKGKVRITSDKVIFTVNVARTVGTVNNNGKMESYAFGLRNNKSTDFVIDDVTVKTNNTSTLDLKYSQAFYLSTASNATAGSVTTINGGYYEANGAAAYGMYATTFAAYNTTVNLNGGTFKTRGDNMVAVGSKTVNNVKYLGNVYVSGGIFMSTNTATPNISSRYTDKVVATVTNGKNLGVCSNTADIAAAINTFGSNGQSVVNMTGDVAGSVRTEYKYGFTLNMNGHTMSTADGNVMDVKGALVVNGDGGTLKTNDTADAGVAAIVARDSLTLSNVRVEAQRGAAVAYQCADGTNKTILIDGCTLITKEHLSYSNNLASAMQQNVHVTIKDSTLVNWNKEVIGAQGDESLNVNNTFTLVGDVHMYQGTVNSSYYEKMEPTAESAAVTKVEGTHTFEGKTGLTLFTTNQATSGHTFASVVTDPTCTEDKYTTYTCTCEETYVVQEENTAKGHDLETVAGKTPTCEEVGYWQSYLCKTCEQYFSDEEGTLLIGDAAALTLWQTEGEGKRDIVGCDLKEIAAKDATCTADGNKQYWQCTVCKTCYEDAEGKEIIALSDTVTPAAHNYVDGQCTVCKEYACGDNHTWGEMVAEETATCISGGHAAYYQCSVCKQYKNEAGDVFATIDSLTTDKDENNHVNMRTVAEIPATVLEEGQGAYHICDDCGVMWADGNGKPGAVITEIPVLPVLPTVAMIGENRYATLDKAIGAAKAGEVVVLQADVEGATINAKYNYIAIGGAKDFTLDLNGKTIDMGSYQFVNAGKLIITDSSEDKTGMITGSNNPVIENKQGGDENYGPGELTIKGGKFTGTGNRVILVTNGTLTMDGGEAYIDTTANGIYNVIEVGANGTAVINKGSTVWIKETSAKDTNEATSRYEYSAVSTVGNLTINGGALTADRNGENYGDGNTQVRAIYVGGGKTTINGGTFTANRNESTNSPHVYALRSGSANITIKGGTFGGNAPLNLQGTVTISGGTFNGRSFINNAALTITGGVFNAKGSAEFFGYSSIKSATISGGIFKNTKDVPLFGKTANGVRYTYDDYNKDAVIAEITNGYNFAFASTPAAMVNAVKEIGADGNAVVTLQKDVTATTTTTFTKSFTLQLNGKTWTKTNEGGYGVAVTGTGSANGLTSIVGPGKIIAPNATHAVRIGAGGLEMKDMEARSNGATVGYCATTKDYNDKNLIEGCTLLSTAYFVVSYHGGKDTAQADQNITIKNSTLINAGSYPFSAYTSGNTGNITLLENVHIYTKASKINASAITVTGTATTKVATGKTVAFNGTDYTDRTLYATSHAGATKTEGQDATCTENGSVAYWTCPTCGVMFSDEACTKVLTDATIVAGHKLNLQGAVPATCAQAGTIAHYTCSSCSKLFSAEDQTKEITDIVDPIKDHDYTGENGVCIYCSKTACENGEHTWTAVVEAKAATCKEAGYKAHFKCEKGDAYAVEVEGQKVITEWHQIVEAKHETHDDLKPNNQKDATCTEAGYKAYWYCSVCEKYYSDAEAENVIGDIDTWKAEGGAGYIKPVGHDWNEGEVTKEPDYNNTGIKTYTCKNDPEHTYTETVPVKEGAKAEVDGVKYGSLTTAISKANGKTVKLLDNIALSEVLEINNTITLDLNGKTISSDNGAIKYINNTGNLTIKDSVGGGKIAMTGKKTEKASRTTCIVNNGDLTIESGELISTSVDGITNYTIFSQTGNVTIIGGTIKAEQPSSSAVYALGLGGNGTVTISNAEFIVTGEAESEGARAAVIYLITDATPQITINGGTFTANLANAPAGASIIREKGSGNKNAKLTINGGTFNIGVKDKGIFETKYCTVSVTGGQFSENVFAKCAEGYHSVQDGDYYVVGEHSYEKKVTEPTCEAEGFTAYTCACGHSYVTDKVTAKGHDFEKGTVTESFDGNCVDKSFVTTKCARCDETETVYGEINKKDHADLKKGEAKAPTCTAIGWDAYEYCTKCDYTTYAEKEMLDHTYGDPVWDWADSKATATATFKCECGDTKDENAIITSKITTAATCTEKGEKTYTATVTFGGETYTDNVKEEIPTKGHEYTYTDNGDRTHTVGCKNCAYSETVNCVDENADNVCDKCDATLATYVAQVGEEKFETLAEAFAAADGKTVTVLTDLEIDSETITIADGKSVTLDMNGKKITVTDNKTGNYELFYIYGEMTVTGNGTIELTATNDRNWNAMSAIFHNRGGKLTIENGTFTHKGGTDMAYVVDNSGNYYGDATTNVEGGELTSSYIAIRNRMEQNSHGASGKAILNVSGGTISGTSRAIWAQAASTNVNAPATGEINVSGGEIGLIDTARGEGAESMTTITGGTVAAFKGEVGELTVKDGTVGTVTILTADGQPADYEITEDGLYAPVSYVAEIDGVGYKTLAEAFAAADGKTVTLLKNIELSEPLTVAAGKTVTLDLAGYEIVYNSTTQNESMITNKGNLTINDSVGTGVINYNYTGAADSTYSKGNYTISNGGTLTVNGGYITIAKLSGHAKYCIDNNSTTGDAVLVINGGHLYNYNTSAIRQFCNSTTYQNAVTINGGLIEGYSAIWMQNPGSKTVNGSLTITGGEIKSTAKAYVEGAPLNQVGSKIYCTTEGGAWSEGSAVAITGGTINENVYLAEEAPAQLTCEGATFNGYVELPETGLKGSGTENDPYQIATVEDLILFRDSVNAGEGKYNAAYVKLMADIDLADINWEPIGNVGYTDKYVPTDATRVFSGTFDGNGKVISNLKMTKTVGGADEEANLGLFGITGDGAAIKDLTLTNVAITTDGRNVGALVAFAYKATISNITVNGDIQIQGGNNVSGVCAMSRYSAMSATNITVAGNDGSYIKGNNIVGGIFAEIAPNGTAQTFKGLSVENVAIEGVGGAGGIVGLLTLGTVENVTVKDVAITAKTEFQGDALGRIRMGSVVGLLGSNYATVKGAAVTNVTGKSLGGAEVELPVVGANYSGSIGNATEAIIGDTYYATFELALKAAKEGDTIVLLQAIEVEAGETKTIDLPAGVTVSLVTDDAETSLIENNGNLTITGEGKLSFKYTGTDTSYAHDTIKSLPGSVLTIKGGQIENLSENCLIAYAVDGMTNGGNGDVTVNIEGGKLSSKKIAVRIFANSTTDTGTMNISGGEISGRVIIQSSNQKANKAVLNITGGIFNTNGYKTDVLYVGGTGSAEAITASVSGGTFNGEILSSMSIGFISGGTFNAPVAEEFCAEGFIPTENADGTYGVKKGAYVAEIDGTKYETLQAAINAATAGQTVTLMKDIALDATVKVTNDVTLEINGKTITGTDNATGSFALIEIQPGKALIVNDTVGGGKITLTATNNRGWNAYSSVISNQRGTLTVNGGTIEHLGGTDMAYGIDSLTNGKGTKAYTTINAGTVKSTYRAIRQFLNGVEAENVLTVNGGTIEGTNKSIWMQDPSKNANTGKLTVTEGATLNGDVYLFVTAGSTEWPVEVSIAASAVNGQILTGNIPAGYFVENNDGIYGVVKGLKGSGTEADPYQIGSVEDLILFRDSVNAGETRYSAPGVYTALTADVDLAGINWVGIGSINAAHGFMGNFDGNGHTIKNLTITDPALDEGGYAYAGLFSITEGEKGAENVIENLIIENVTISTTGHIVSAAIAYPYYTTVKNVAVCGDINITGGDYTSGVLAYTRRCVNASDLTISGNAGSTITGKSTVGGVISDIQMNGGLTANYSNFSASGLTIKGEKNVGGISGIISSQSLDGAEVKDVALVCSDARVGTVAGSLGGASTVTNVVVENVTGAANVIGAGFDSGTAVEAKIGNTYYTTFELALAAAKADDTVELLADVDAAEAVVIDKTITLNGNGYALNSTATRAVNVDCAGQVTIKDLTITGASNTERAINVIQKAAKLTLDNVTAVGFKYTLNVAASSVGSEITVNGGKLSGYAAINITGNNTTVTVKDAELIGVNDVSAHETNNFGVIAIGSGTTDVKVTVTGGSLTATSDNGNRQFAVVAVGAENATVVVDAELNLVNKDVFAGYPDKVNASFRAAYADELLAQGYMTKTSATAGLVDVTEFAAASVNGVGYTDLQDAIDAAEELGEATVTVLNNIEVTHHIIVSEGITLDLNGSTVKTTRYITVYGDVVDGTAGGEGVVIAAKTHVMGEQSFMSIYDSTVGGYRFYAYEVEGVGTKTEGNTVKFGIRLNFVNSDAYTVITNTEDTKFELHAYISWTGIAAPMDYTFSAATIKTYATGVASDLASNGTSKKTIVLTVSGTDVLGEDGEVTLTPVLESETYLSGSAVAMNWKANS